MNVRETIEKIKEDKLERNSYIYLFLLVAFTFLTPIPAYIAVQVREVFNVFGTALFLVFIASFPIIIMTIISKAPIEIKLKVLVISLIVISIMSFVGYNFLSFIRPYLHI